MKTLKSKIEIKGVGLMSGIETVLEITPSDKRGIRFHNGNCTIEANLNNVVSTEHCVVLGCVEELSKCNELAKVALVEHFMSACAICKIDALDVYFKSKSFEIPILDGSAKLWVQEFNETGYVGEQCFVKPLESPITFIKGNSSVVLIPQEDETQITYAVNYNHPDLKNRFASMKQNENLPEIIEARTFGYLKDLDKLQSLGYSKGVTIENTVGLTDNGYTTELRSEFEPIKHKILDIIGDFYLTGVNPLDLKVNIKVKEAGHALHVEAAKLLAQKSGV